MEKQKFALIGSSLKHSYSKIIHAKLGEYPYELVELEENQLKAFVDSEVCGFNVTIPYKKKIIEYLDELDESALKIGAVNTVVKRDGKAYGYNTDFKGMIYMLSRAGISVKDKCVLILGSGGTSNTATAVCEYLGAKEIISVSRSGKVNYENCYELTDTEIIINTTPVGMYPNTDGTPIDIDKFDKLLAVVDVIYNPRLTKLIYNAKEKGLKYTSGLPMLVAQAKYAKDLFYNQTSPDSVIESVIDEIYSETLNIVLIGMPGSGKSTIGEILSEKLNREFIDTDEEIVKRVGKSIPEIFEEDGEEYFRKVESEVLIEVGKQSGKIIATGGGVVKNVLNYFPLKCNGKIFYLERSIEKLSTDGRPLSKDRATIEKLYQERKDAYKKFADITVNNDTDIEITVKGVIDNL
ncbi:MAG: shikimate dehydrogenase [Clostridia bacterium]|nr:shikimate dehydrogenase [Clostridia bacterium]